MRVVVDGEYGALVEKNIADAERTIATNLKWRKEALDMKLWELSAVFGGMDLGALSRYINGKKEFTVSVLVKFSTALGVELGDWYLPHKEFKAKYESVADAPFQVRVVPTAGSRSSSRSKADGSNNRATREYFIPSSRPA